MFVALQMEPFFPPRICNPAKTKYTTHKICTPPNNTHTPFNNSDIQRCTATRAAKIEAINPQAKNKIYLKYKIEQRTIVLG